MFIWFSLTWSLGCYVAAWMTGDWGSTSGDFGFDQAGNLAIPSLLICTGITTAGTTLNQIRRRHRRAR
jgi:hypothetical protein